MKVEVLGSGCPKCYELERRARMAVERTGVQAQVSHVYDVEEMAERGVVSTPALALDGTVVAAGVLLTVEEISELLKKHAKGVA